MPIYIKHWGDNLQFYPNFALFWTLGGMKLDHNFFHVKEKWQTFKMHWANQVKTKKKVFIKLVGFLSPEIKWRLKKVQRSSSAQMQQIIGEDAVKLLGGYIPPFPPGFGTHALKFCTNCTHPLTNCIKPQAFRLVLAFFQVQSIYCLFIATMQKRASKENFLGGAIKIEPVLTTKNGRIFEIW